MQNTDNDEQQILDLLSKRFDNDKLLKIISEPANYFDKGKQRKSSQNNAIDLDSIMQPF